MKWPKRKKIREGMKKWSVEFLDSVSEVYVTSAVTEEEALSNAVYRYAQDIDEEVGLVAYKVRNGEILYLIEEGDGT